MPNAVFDGDAVRILKDIFKAQSGQEIITNVSDIDIASGVVAPVGSLALTTDGSVHIKYTAPDTGWTALLTSVLGYIPLYGFDSDQRDNIALSFVDGTRTLTITPTAATFFYNVDGVKYVKTGAQNIVIDETEGLHLVYYNGETLTTIANGTTAQIEEILLTSAPVSFIYWDDTNKQENYFSFETHGPGFTPEIRLFNHNVFGTQYVRGLGLGDFVIGDGSLNSHAQFSISEGSIYDEDLETEIATVLSTTSIYNHYVDGAMGYQRKLDLAGFPVLTDVAAGVGVTGRLVYNEWTGSAWQLTTVTSGNFVLYHVFAVNSVHETGKLISVIGQNDYLLLAGARDGALSEISSLLRTLPEKELLPIATIIYQTKDSYSNDVKAKIVTDAAGENYVDWRTSKITASASATDHNNLGGLDLSQAGVTWGHINDIAQTIAGNKTFTDNINSDGQIYSAIYTLTDGATITPDWDDGNVQEVILEGNRTIANPSNAKNGAIYTLAIIQDATGSRTLTWGSNYKWPDGKVPFLNTSPSTTDIFQFTSDGTNLFHIIESQRIDTESLNANDTADLTHNYRTINYDNTTNDYAFTIPPNVTTAFPIGSWMELRKTGSGEITLTKGSGVTFSGVLGDVNVKLDGEEGYSTFIEKTAINTWLISGSIKAV